MNQNVNLNNNMPALPARDAFLNSEKFHKNTDKYQHITTADLEPVMKDLGYELFQVTQAKVRKPENVGFQRHVARFRSTESFLNGEVNSEVVIVNAHRIGSLRVIGGAYRTFCANGIVVGTTGTEYRIRHIGDVEEQINTILPLVAKQTPIIMGAMEQMKSKQLNSVQMMEFAEKVAMARLADKMTDEAGSITSLSNVSFGDLLTARREADKATDLFTVYNRVQENMMRHGLGYTIIGENGKIRQSRTRKVKENSLAYVEINQLIWNTAMETAAA